MQNAKRFAWEVAALFGLKIGPRIQVVLRG